MTLQEGANAQFYYSIYFACVAGLKGERHQRLGRVSSFCCPMHYVGAAFAMATWPSVCLSR